VGKRGREARLRPEFARLYPGLEPGTWLPVEKLLRHVTNLIHQDRSRSGIITGERLLHDEHFEYRGASPRPDGLPSRSTRLSDSGIEPSRQPAGLSGSDQQPAKRKGTQG
jgi:hypothetical protein